jgi:hypothetical protein
VHLVFGGRQLGDLKAKPNQTRSLLPIFAASSRGPVERFYQHKGIDERGLIRAFTRKD